MKTRASQKKQKLVDKTKQNNQKQQKNSTNAKKPSQEKKQISQKNSNKANKKKVQTKKNQQNPKFIKEELEQEKCIEKKVKKTINSQKNINLNEKATPKSDKKKKETKLIKKSSKIQQKEDKQEYNNEECSIKDQVHEQLLKTNPLSQQLQDLIALLFDKKLLNKQLKELGYDTNFSLQQLQEKNLIKGYQILTKLSESIKQKKPEYLLKQYSQDFYSFIPHIIQLTDSKRYIIDCEKKVQTKVEMLQSLREIQAAFQQIDSIKQNTNLFEEYYKGLHCVIEPLNKNENEFKIIEKYIENTHGPTHTQYILEFFDAFKITRKNEDEKFRKDIKKNKLLLWYATKLTNYAGLLKNGFKIPPIEAPSTAYDFGKGIYFSDMVTKSANQCCTDQNHNIGLLMLCEVACGAFNEKFYADYKLSQLPEGKLATKACGKFQPESRQKLKYCILLMVSSQTELNGFKVPLGKPETISVLGSLQYNEYVVYDVSQIRMKYLVKCKFNYKAGNQYF